MKRVRFEENNEIDICELHDPDIQRQKIESI